MLALRDAINSEFLFLNWKYHILSEHVAPILEQVKH